MPHESVAERAVASAELSLLSRRLLLNYYERDVVRVQYDEVLRAPLPNGRPDS